MFDIHSPCPACRSVAEGEDGPPTLKIGFDWVCFGWFKVGCSLLLAIVITNVTTILVFRKLALFHIIVQF
jgi:threonine aldolase